jgi:long-subunit fatty acid transport protein
MKPAGSLRRPFRFWRHLTACIVCLLPAFVASRVFANGVIRDSVGATSSGRGGTNIAAFDNGPILLSNPGSLVNIRGNELFEIGVDSVFTDVDYSDPENFGANDTQFSPLPQFTYIRASEDHLWAAGIGVYAPAGYSADWDLNNPVLGNASYSSFGALVKIIPGAAVKLTDQLSIGATMGLAVSRVELSTPFYAQTGVLGGLNALSVLDVAAKGFAPTWSVGAQYRLTDRTTLGLVYSSEDRFKLYGAADAAVYGFGPPLKSHFDTEVDLVWPQSVGGGISHLFGDRHRVSADLVWYDWSHAFDRIDLKFSESTNPIVPILAGDPLGDSFPLKWDDGLSVKLGYEFYRTDCDIVRFGYVHNTANIPAGTLTPLIPATMEHSFTVGYGRWWNQWRTDLAYQYAWSPDREVGNSILVGDDFSNAVNTSQAHWVMVSFLRQF